MTSKTPAAVDSKRAKRLENKKRKIAAFLDLAKLNEEDGGYGRAKVSKLERPDFIFKKDEEEKEKKPRLEGEELAALRARLKARKKMLVQLPNFELKSTGRDASLSMESNLRTPLMMPDLQHLLMYLLVGDRTPYEPFRWCKVDKWNRLTNIVCLVIDNLEKEEDTENKKKKEAETDKAESDITEKAKSEEGEDSTEKAEKEEEKAVPAIGEKEFRSRVESDDENVKFMQENLFTHGCLEFVSPAAYGSSMAVELSLLPVTQRRRRILINDLKKENASMKDVIEAGKAYTFLRSVFPIKRRKAQKTAIEDSGTPLKLRLLMSVNQLMDENYPVALPGVLKEKYKDFVLTKDEYLEVNGDSPMFSVDCEMCITEGGASELTRICVVDSDCKVVYHTFVKPHTRIVNYLTRYSGITEEMLLHEETRLHDVQQKLREILPSDAILVGQSLENDLRAMQMMHPYIIDTGIIYNMTGNRKRKTKLKTLSEVFLKQEIQSKGKDGHNPQEDAEAAMKLVNLKLEKGYEFGDILLSGPFHLDEVKSEETKNNPDEKSVVENANSASGVTGDKLSNHSFCLSMLQEVKKREKTVKIVAQEGPAAEDYARIPGAEEFVTSAPSFNEAISSTCDSAFNHDLTVCHVAMEHKGGGDKTWAKVRKYAEKLWNHTSENGMFIAVMAGDRQSNAVVGISLKKKNLKNL